MNAKIPCDKTIDLFGGSAPLAVSTDPVTGNITEYHSIEDFVKAALMSRILKLSLRAIFILNCLIITAKNVKRSL